MINDINIYFYGPLFTKDGQIGVVINHEMTLLSLKESA